MFPSPQVVYFRPGDIFKYNMSKHVPVNDRIAFQSAANESLLILMKVASARAGFNIESITQASHLPGPAGQWPGSWFQNPQPASVRMLHLSVLRRAALSGQSTLTEWSQTNRSWLQVLDLQGMSAMQMVSHMRSPDAQREWQHNLDFMPESLHKVGPTTFLCTT